MLKRIIPLPLVILLMSCSSNETTALTKDAYFSRNCAEILIAKQVHKNCTYEYYRLRDNNWRKNCDSGNNVCALNNAIAATENKGSTLKNRVTIMCLTPWGEEKKSEYWCKYNDDGEVLYTSVWWDDDAFLRALQKDLENFNRTRKEK